MMDRISAIDKQLDRLMTLLTEGYINEDVFSMLALSLHKSLMSEELEVKEISVNDVAKGHMPNE